MSGSLSSESGENVVRVADNGYLTDFTITTQKIQRIKLLFQETKLY